MNNSDEYYGNRSALGISPEFKAALDDLGFQTARAILVPKYMTTSDCASLYGVAGLEGYDIGEIIVVAGTWALERVARITRSGLIWKVDLKRRKAC